MQCYEVSERDGRQRRGSMNDESAEMATYLEDTMSLCVF